MRKVGGVVGVGRFLSVLQRLYVVGCGSHRFYIFGNNQRFHAVRYVKIAPDFCCVVGQSNDGRSPLVSDNDVAIHHPIACGGGNFNVVPHVFQKLLVGNGVTDVFQHVFGRLLDGFGVLFRNRFKTVSHGFHVRYHVTCIALGVGNVVVVFMSVSQIVAYGNKVFMRVAVKVHAMLQLVVKSQGNKLEVFCVGEIYFNYNKIVVLRVVRVMRYA